jgi:hypothetical protein
MIGKRKLTEDRVRINMKDIKQMNIFRIYYLLKSDIKQKSFDELKNEIENI